MYIDTLIAIVVEVASMMVWPSGAARASAAAAITVAEPALFSTTKGRPKRRSSRCANSRAKRSVPPPAA